MPQQKLTRAYLYQGVTYGPGVANLPDDEAFLARVEAKEAENQVTIQDERRQLLSTLPQGHPMRALIEESEEDTAPEQAVAPVAVGADKPNPRRAPTAPVSPDTSNWSGPGKPPTEPVAPSTEPTAPTDDK